MTYFFNNPMYPKNEIIELISKGTLSINSRGFICGSLGCGQCPLWTYRDAFCHQLEFDSERRKQIVAIIKDEYPEYFI